MRKGGGFVICERLVTRTLPPIVNLKRYFKPLQIRNSPCKDTVALTGTSFLTVNDLKKKNVRKQIWNSTRRLVFKGRT